MEDSSSLLERSVLQAVNTIFSFLTILCVINMFIVGRTKTIKERLGNANLKFMGARLLLLIIAVQEQAANALTMDSDMNKQVVAKAAERGLDMSAFRLTHLQADLLHISLLNFECLFVVCFNVFAWRDLDLERTGVAIHGYSNVPTDVEAPEVAAVGAYQPASGKDCIETSSQPFRSRESAPLLLGTEAASQL